MAEQSLSERFPRAHVGGPWLVVSRGVMRKVPDNRLRERMERQISLAELVKYTETEAEALSSKDEIIITIDPVLLGSAFRRQSRPPVITNPYAFQEWLHEQVCNRMETRAPGLFVRGDLLEMHAAAGQALGEIVEEQAFRVPERDVVLSAPAAVTREDIDRRLKAKEITRERAQEMLRMVGRYDVHASADHATCEDPTFCSCECVVCKRTWERAGRPKPAEVFLS